MVRAILPGPFKSSVMSKVIVEIRPLIVSAHEHLRKQAFSVSTLKKYSRLWDRIADYMASLGLDAYNRKVGQDFLELLFGRFSYSQLSVQEKTVVRKVQYLTEFQEKGFVRGKRKNAEPDFKGDIGNLMKNFITSRQESGFAEPSSPGLSNG